MIEQTKMSRWVHRLQNFATNPATREEHCDLCCAPVMSVHRHLLEPATAKVLCVCDACRILFDDRSDGRFRLIPTSLSLIDDFEMSDSELKGLGIPIGLVFLTRSSTATVPSKNDLVVQEPAIVGWYPSPAGVVQTSIDPDLWEPVVGRYPSLKNMHVDLEALLINRTRQNCYGFVVPIDVCYQLVGIVRRHWQGWQGGKKVWDEIDQFFERLRLQLNARSNP